MDSHIAAAPDLLDQEDGLSARLPGEPAAPVAPVAPADPDALHAASATRKPEPIARTASAAPRKRCRSAWLAGGAIAAVLVGGAGFALSPYNHILPLPAGLTTTVHRLAAQAGIDLDRPLAPAASLASVNLPPAPAAVVAPRYQPKPRDASLRELLALRPGPPDVAQANGPPSPAAAPSGPAASAPVQQASAAPDRQASPPQSPPQTPPPQTGFMPHEPGSPLGQPPAAAAATPPPSAAASPPSGHGPTDVTQAVVAAATGRGPEAGGSQNALELRTAAAASPARASPAEAAPPAPASPPPSADAGAVPGASSAAAVHPAGQEASPPTRLAVAGAVDPAEALRRMRPAPMTPSDQLQVLQLVAQMATMVHDMKQQNQALRADFAKAQEDQHARLQDFERRVDLTEARAALAAADPPPPPLAPPIVNPASVRPIAITRAAAALPAILPADAKRYRVQAASPGLALLAEIDRGGGDGAQLQVVVGDALPGWGKVKSVAQRGASWVVATEHGVIE